MFDFAGLMRSILLTLGANDISMLVLFGWIWVVNKNLENTGNEIAGEGSEFPSRDDSCADLLFCRCLVLQPRVNSYAKMEDWDEEHTPPPAPVL